MARQSLAKGLGKSQCFGAEKGLLLLTGLGTLRAVLGASLHPAIDALGDRKSTRLNSSHAT